MYVFAPPCHHSCPTLPPSTPFPLPDFFLDLWLTEGRAVVLSRLMVALGFPVGWVRCLLCC